MGGQACVFYGAAEFTRDSDFAVQIAAGNLRRLENALAELEAERVYVPELDSGVLRRGHACHFRCQAPGLNAWRVDVMGVMRGCGSFPSLWRRRTQLRLASGEIVNLMSVEDLVRAKKTQREKDWPMIARLVEADFRAGLADPSAARVRFWLREARTVVLLQEVAERFPAETRRLKPRRAALTAVLSRDSVSAREALLQEQLHEQETDRAYWRPLRKELELLRKRQPPRSRGSV